MNILFLGGNGNISWHCVQQALGKGHAVTEWNRGMTRATRRTVQPEVEQLIGDINNEEEARTILGDRSFDVICDFICFDDQQAKERIHLFAGRTKQYIYISSEAVYRRESRYLPFREDTPQYGTDIRDSYIAGKVRAERSFRESWEKLGFPVTIVRPGYTYDTIIQVPIGQNCFTAPNRFLSDYPLLMLGDGENLCAPMHSRDFAKAFVALIGNPVTIGEDYHIAGEMLITWREMAEELLLALGLPKGNIVFIPRAEGVRITSFYSEIVNRQHMWHYIFDNRKIKSIAKGWRQQITFREGIAETVQWLMEEPVRRRINPRVDAELEKLYQIYWKRSGET